MSKLQKFLAENDLTDQFEINRTNEVDGDSRYAILDAFNWSNSTEGHDFWIIIDSNYQDSCYE